VLSFVKKLNVGPSMADRGRKSKKLIETEVMKGWTDAARPRPGQRQSENIGIWVGEVKFTDTVLAEGVGWVN
jgi:hypothetical protein